jgi:hypothetical protein
MRAAARSGALLLAFLAAAAAPAPAAGPDAAGGREPIAVDPIVLLPIQDRTGDPEAAAAVAAALRGTLAATHALVEPERVRRALRAQRVRDSGALPPSLLARLARDLGAGSFFSCTLHRAGDSPGLQVIVAGRLLRPDREPLAWAGFEWGSRNDGLTWLMRGRVDDRPALLRAAARRLAGGIDAPPRTSRTPPASAAVRLQPIDLPAAGVIAVIPFDATTDAPGASEIATDLALAVLHRHGARLAAPGAVEEVLRRRGLLLRGEIDAVTRAALRAASGADLLFTGTVEALAAEGGDADGAEPRAALAARLLRAEDGRILWTAGEERGGFGREGWFQRGRVFALGRLAEEMMESFVASFAGPATVSAGRIAP